MDTLQLAVVSAETLLPQALNRIRKGTRALVVQSPERPPLMVTAGDIMATWNNALDHQRNPREVQVGTVIPTRWPTRVPMNSPGSVPPTQFSAGVVVEVLGAPPPLIEYEGFFDQNDDRYAIHQIIGDTATVVTASERYTADLSTAITICRCIGNPVHTFEPRQLVNPNVCNKPHGASVVCTLLSGTTL